MCNKFRQSKIFVELLLGLTSCGQNLKLKNVKTDTLKINIVTKELWTIYSKQDAIFHVKRLLLTDIGLILLSYDINTPEPEVSEQSFLSSNIVANKDEATAIKLQNSNFNWTPYKTVLTLFIQIEPSAFKDEMEQYEKRQGFLDKIEKALLKHGHAEWTGCDVGRGGLNMLFEVENIDTAIPTILEVLSKLGLDKKAVIGRRINTEAEDWFYEVVYPNAFNGVFLTM